MPKNPTGLAVAPTKLRWNDGIEFDFKTLFVGLGKSLVKLNYQDLPGAALAAADAVKAVGKKTDPEQLARQWVLRALTRAVYQIAGDSYQILARTKADAEDLDAKAQKSLQDQPVLLNQDTLNDPAQLPLVKAVEKPLAQWLQGWDVDPTPSKTIASRLGVYFTRALYDEWNRGFSTADQAAMRQVLDNPITTAVVRDWAWSDYHNRLEQEVAEPVFGIEPFSLEQIHVDLHGYHETRKKTKGRQAVEEEEPEKTVVKVKDHLNEWLDNNKRGDEYRVVSGGPGAGKSSLAKMFAVERIRRPGNSWRVLFVHLHRVNLKTSLADAIKEFLSPYPLVHHNPLAHGTNEPKLLLILDGLDEVTEQGKVGASAARSLLRDVENRVAGYAAGKATLKVLVTGRPAAVDAAELTQARDPGVLLHLLSYKNDEIKADLRAEWWAKYAKWKKKSKQGLKKFIDKVPEDVTAQPLLLYLTAFAEDEGFQFDDDFNLNKLYGFLLERVHERAWDKSRGHPTTERIEFDDFAEALEAVAVAAWHGSGRGITLTGVKQARDGALPPALGKMLQSNQGLLRLMVAFYFQRSGFKGQEEAFEFTHKSFGEYLTARSIARRLGEIIEDLDTDRKKKRRKYDIRDALADWARLCGPRKIDRDLLIFIHNEISTIQPDVGRARQAELGGWIGHVLENGMPMEQIDRLKTFGEQNRQSVNAETALLVMLDSCARVTGEPSPVEWPNLHSAANWLARIMPHEEFYGFSVVTASLRSLPLKGLALFGANLSVADLSGTDLSDANLSGADLTGANLRDANLRDANLRDANLSDANLSDANLSGAHLRDAHLRRANLSVANLSGANLRGANLRGADLSGANLSAISAARISARANLRGANLSGRESPRRESQRRGSQRRDTSRTRSLPLANVRT